MSPLIEHWLPKNELQFDAIQEQIKSGKMAVVFVLPFPSTESLDRMTSNVSLTGEDSRFYVLQNLLQALDVKIIEAETKKLSWQEVLELHEELAEHLEEDGKNYPEAEENFRSWLSGEWTRLVLSTEKLQPLQEKIKAIRGSGVFHDITEPSVCWNNRITVKPIRAILGDRTPPNNNDDWWPFPIRYNFFHVPDNAQEAIEINQRWQKI